MLQELKAFVAVVDEKSLTRAASRLFLTQSAISRRIQQLEDRLGAPVLDRASRPPTPTPLGSRIYEQAVAVLRDVDQLLCLPKEDATPSGTLRLGVSHAIGDSIAAAAVKHLKAEFPQLDVRLRTAWGPALSERAVAGELDAAVMLLPASATPNPLLVGRPLAPLPMAVVQSRDAPRIATPVPIASLASEDWILNPLGCGYRAELARAMGCDDDGLRIVVDTHGTELQLRMVADGLGLGLVPRSLIMTSASRAALSIVDLVDFTLTLDIWLVHRGRLGNLRRPVDAVGRLVTDRFAAMETAAP